MRIESIYANNFKSLVDFRLRLAKFTCLIGLNGSGKSTVLQFVDFLAQQVRGDLAGWLEERGWRAGELSSRLLSRKNVEFRVHLTDDRGDNVVTWSGSFHPVSLHCTTERVEAPTTTLVVRDGICRISERSGAASELRPVRNEEISFTYQGSILSQLRDQALPGTLRDLKSYLAGVTPLLFLSPRLLRQRTRASGGSLGLGGERLSAYLYELGASGRARLAEQLRRAYPHLEQLDASSTRSGWKRLEVEERYGSRSIRTEAKHVNDGLLRLTAILAELSSDRPLLLFDEIENGINPELVDLLIGEMLAARQQVLVTTHSPLILNYLTDEQARTGVVYLHRNIHGATHAVHFFSIPSLAKKLTVMGPGEAFVDTDLTSLDAELQQMPTEPDVPAV